MKKYKGLPQCDDCHNYLEKEFVVTFNGNALIAWVCPKSELWKIYQKSFKKKYHLEKINNFAV